VERKVSVRLSVRLSVRPSVKRVGCDKTEQKYVQLIFIPHERSFSLVSRKKNRWWKQLILPKILG